MGTIFLGANITQAIQHVKHVLGLIFGDWVIDPLKIEFVFMNQNLEPRHMNCPIKKVVIIQEDNSYK